MNVCKSLSAVLQVPPNHDGTALGVAAAINILTKCKKIRCLEVIQNEPGVSIHLHKLLCEVVRNEGLVLKKVCFRSVNFSGVAQELVDCLSVKFHELEEFELCGVLIDENTIAKFVKFCKQGLLKLTIMDLVSPLTRPLSLEPFTSLKYLSVSRIFQ